MHAFRTCKSHDHRGRPNPYSCNNLFAAHRRGNAMKVAPRTRHLVFAASALLLACGGEDSNNTFDTVSGTGTGGGTGSGGGSARDGSVGFGGSLILGPSDAGSGQIILEDGDICAGQTATVTAVPFDMFIM